MVGALPFELTPTSGREESAGELIAKAREALDEARGAGRDTVVTGRRVVLEAVLIPE